MTADTVIFSGPETLGRRAFDQQIGIAAPQKDERAGYELIAVTRKSLIGLRHGCEYNRLVAGRGGSEARPYQTRPYYQRNLPPSLDPDNGRFRNSYCQPIRTIVYNLCWGLSTQLEMGWSVGQFASAEGAQETLSSITSEPR